MNPIFSTMKKLFIILYIFCFFRTSDTLANQFYFDIRQHNEYSFPNGQTILSNDSAVIFVAMTYDSSFLNKYISVSKISQYGSAIWNKTFLFHDLDYLGFTKIVQSPDSGFLILLVIPDTANPNVERNTVMKLDMNGNFLFSRSYYGITANTMEDILVKPDNGYLMTGGGCQGSNYVINCNSNGDILWQKQYIYLGSIQGSIGIGLKIIQSSDGNYVICGHTSFQQYIFKIDSSGNCIWHQSFNSLGFPVINSLIETSDGGFVVCGSLHTQNSFVKTGFVYKTNSMGAKQWLMMRDTSTSNYTLYSDISLNADGNLYIVGYIYNGRANYLFEKIDLAGNILFRKIGESDPIYGPGNDALYTIESLANGQLIISGYKRGIFLERMDNTGFGECSFRDTVFSVLYDLSASAIDTVFVYQLNFSIDSQLVWSEYLTEHTTEDVACTPMGIPLTDGTHNSFSLFPNPATNQFTVSSEQNQPGELEVYNMVGEKIYSTAFSERITINCEHFPGGLYFIKLLSENGSSTQKLLIR